MNGLELQRQMIAADWQIPIIFITSHVDDEAQARALDAGARTAEADEAAFVGARSAPPVRGIDRRCISPPPRI